MSHQSPLALGLVLSSFFTFATCSAGSGKSADTVGDSVSGGEGGQPAQSAQGGDGGARTATVGGSAGMANELGGQGGTSIVDGAAGKATDARMPDSAPLPSACNGALFIDSFEAGDDHGWTHKLLVPKLADPWVRGTSVAPSCHDGTKCWTTGLVGPYAPCIEGELASPVIDLSACASTAKIRVSFWQWQEIEGFAENRYFDGGFLQISKDSGATWASLSAAAMLQPPYIGTSGVYDQCPAFLAPLSGQKIWADKVNNSWKQAHFDLPAEYLTKGFRLRFVFGADIHDGGRGWMIDEFSVNAM